MKNVTYSGLKGSGVSDGDIDGQVEVDTKGPAPFFVTARKRLTKKAGVEWTQNWTSGDGGYDAELKEARLIKSKK